MREIFFNFNITPFLLAESDPSPTVFPTKEAPEAVSIGSMAAIVTSIVFGAIVILDLITYKLGVRPKRRLLIAKRLKNKLKKPKSREKSAKKAKPTGPFGFFFRRDSQHYHRLDSSKSLHCTFQGDTSTDAPLSSPDNSIISSLEGDSPSTSTSPVSARGIHSTFQGDSLSDPPLTDTSYVAAPVVSAKITRVPTELGDFAPSSKPPTENFKGLEQLRKFLRRGGRRNHITPNLRRRTSSSLEFIDLDGPS